MAKIRVVTDSASDVPEDLVQHLNIDVVSLTIRFGDEEFVDRVDLSPQEFWQRCKDSKTLPETAAPSPGAFQTAYLRAKDDGCDGVIVITISSLLSATHQSAVLAADAVADQIAVRVIDTLAVSMGEGFIAVDVAERAQEGVGLDDLVERATLLKAKSGVVATLDTLEHLIKGGRIGGAKAFLGQVLAIKPLVQLHDGIVDEAGRSRTRAKALATVAAIAKSHEPLARLALIHGSCHDVDALEALIHDIDVATPVVITDIGPVVGTHGGPGIMGLTWIEA